MPFFVLILIALYVIIPFIHLFCGLFFFFSPLSWIIEGRANIITGPMPAIHASVAHLRTQE